MSPTLTKNNEFWLDFDGLKVSVGGNKYKISAKKHNAIYPYAYICLVVDAEQLPLGSNKYLIDVLGSEPEITTKFEKACKKKIKNKKI